MYQPTLTDIRNFFFEVYNKHNNNIILTELENIALSIILKHPEYNNILSNKNKYLNYQWFPENGETNPFLHLSMHMSIQEQLSINHPPSIVELFQKLCLKYKDEHEASHQLMDCIAEMLWQSQKNNTQPDIKLYLSCINSKLS